MNTSKASWTVLASILWNRDRIHLTDSPVCDQFMFDLLALHAVIYGFLWRDIHFNKIVTTATSRKPIPPVSINAFVAWDKHQIMF